MLRLRIRYNIYLEYVIKIKGESHMKSPIKVAVTGAAGQIGYSILFRIASGEMLGKDQPIILQLLDLTDKIQALEGVIMELEDCAFPLLHGTTYSDDPLIAFKEAEIAILIGSRPRSKGMERKDLLEANGKIFIPQGEAIAKVANPNVKVLVVGNPANTNALIAMHAALKVNPNFNKRNFTAMLRLDHNRALSQLAKINHSAVDQLNKVCVWGNHSSTQYPDSSYLEINNTNASAKLDPQWVEQEFIPTVQQRGGAIINARGLSSAASAANAAINHIHDWVLGSNSKWVSMGVLSDGSYDIPEDVIFGFPVICDQGDYKIVQGLEINQNSRDKITTTYNELLQEKQTIENFL